VTVTWPFEWTASSDESMVTVPPEIVTATAPLIPLALGVSAAVAACPPGAPGHWPQVLPGVPAALLALALPPPVVRVTSPPVMEAVVSAWMPSAPAVMATVPPETRT